jgi:hypothetical protein
MRVWDGTGQAPSDPLPIPLPLSSQDNLRQGDPPPAALSKIASIIRGMKAGDATNDESLASLQVPESTCGKVANVIIWERHHWILIENHVPIGTFLRLRNVDVRHYMNNPFRCKHTSWKFVEGTMSLKLCPHFFSPHRTPLFYTAKL